MRRFAGFSVAVGFCALTFIASVVAWSAWRESEPRAIEVADLGSNGSVGFSGAVGSPVSAIRSADRIEVRKPTGSPQVALSEKDPHGNTAKVACSTCHALRSPDYENRFDDSLDTFHQGLTVNHGKLACYSCHNPRDAETLRLADDTTLAYRDVIQLCSQCHAAQANSFAHGAHGGMNGFWDLSRGRQFKNNCIDCHHPHHPKFPKMIVDFKPIDRFLHEEAAHGEHR